MKVAIFLFVRFLRFAVSRSYRLLLLPLFYLKIDILFNTCPGVLLRYTVSTHVFHTQGSFSTSGHHLTTNVVAHGLEHGKTHKKNY